MLSSLQHERKEREIALERGRQAEREREREAIPVPDQKGAEEGGTKL